jgi:hypothetical protein
LVRDNFLITRPLIIILFITLLFPLSLGIIISLASFLVFPVFLLLSLVFTNILVFLSSNRDVSLSSNRDRDPL